MTHLLTRAPTHKIQLCWCQTCLSNLISSILQQQKKIEQLLALGPVWSTGLYSLPRISDMCDARVMTIIGSVKESPASSLRTLSLGGSCLWPALLSRLWCNYFPNREPPANIQLYPLTVSFIIQKQRILYCSPSKTRWAPSSEENTE